MEMKKIVFACLASLMCIVSSYANNVKIVGDIKVTTAQLSGNIASFDFTVTWENSWRDDFNHDAVYVFLKYKLDEEGENWNHLFLANEMELEGQDGETFDYEFLNPTGAANKNVGLIIRRKKSGYGASSVKVKAKWDITSNPARTLVSNNFDQGKVFMSAMAIEMVYVPQMPFHIGDSQLSSPKDSLRFRHYYRPIPEKWDAVSDEYDISVKDGKTVVNYLPEYAANHMNDMDRTNTTNAWKGTAEADQYWRIDFGMKNGKETGEKKTIRYFAIESVTGGVPANWELRGKNDLGSSGTLLYPAKEGDTPVAWVTASPRVYPATQAIKIEKPESFRYYEIRITDLGGIKAPIIKTIAMTETDLEKDYDHSVLIQDKGLTMTNALGADINQFYTDDGDVTGNVKLNANYPNGFSGFYAMKYEISQEQYVSFLNKLNLAQQNIRTVGEKLVTMKVGQYVFGSDATNPPHRNGIILAARNGITEPVVFANNLNPEDGEYAQSTDGQTVACNYLTPMDMLAYADWTGLRPLSELEYEKMSRQPYPATPLRGFYAWGTTECTFPDDANAIEHAGEVSESISSGNANGGNVLGGPVRCGAFAKGATSQQESGSSFWGIADLSGNLAEIYYNLNEQGRVFSGLPRANHGNGTLLNTTGDSDVAATIWPINGNAFALRGGSFKSESKELQVADRSLSKGRYETGRPNVRHEDVTFRLGCSLEQTTFNSVLTLQNGLQVAEADAADTICSGEDYLIRGDIPDDIEGAYSIIWLYSHSASGPWFQMKGEHGRDLRLKNLRNIHTVENNFMTYCYKRCIYSSQGYSFSKAAIIKIINTEVELSPRDVTVDIVNTSSAITIRSKLPMTVQWQFKGQALKDLSLTVREGKEWQHTPVYNDFTYSGIVNSGRQPLVLYRYFYDGFCAGRDTIWANVRSNDANIAKSDEVICGNPFRDAREGESGNIYNTVAIGTQCWMADNLNYASSGSKCYQDNDNNCRMYGRLYNWNQAKSACPAGWKLPTDDEWTTIANASGTRGTDIKRNDWDNGTNKTGFSALPGGGMFYSYSGSRSTYAGINSRNGFADLASRGWWWTLSSATRFWNTSYTYGYATMPYYVMLDANGFNKNTVVAYGYNNYGYMTSIFSSSDYRHLASSDNDNRTAQNNMAGNFYFSVRCVRTKALQPDEITK